MNNYWIFEDVNLFSLICPHKFKAYASDHSFLNYQKNEYIYFQGDVSSTIFLVNSGKVKIGYIDKNGEEYVFAYLKKGDVFGENVLLNETHRKEFAQAAEKNTSLCSITLRQAEDLLKGNSSFSTRIYKFIGMKLRKVERRYQMMLFRDARTRIVEFIKDMLDEYPNPIKLITGEMMIKNAYSQNEMAKLVGTSRATFNMLLNELEQEGYLSYQRDRIILKNRLLSEIRHIIK